jgi:hypothetical protein
VALTSDEKLTLWIGCCVSAWIAFESLFPHARAGNFNIAGCTKDLQPVALSMSVGWDWPPDNEAKNYISWSVVELEAIDAVRFAIAQNIAGDVNANELAVMKFAGNRLRAALATKGIVSGDPIIKSINWTGNATCPKAPVKTPI